MITTTSAVDSAQLRRLVLDLPETFVRVKGILSDRRNPGQQMLVQFDGTRSDAKVFASTDVDDEDGPRRGEGSPDCGVGRLVLIAAGDHTGTPEAVTSLARALDGKVDD